MKTNENNNDDNIDHTVVLSFTDDTTPTPTVGPNQDYIGIQAHI